MERLSNTDVCIAYSQKVKTLGESAEYEHVLTSMAKQRPQVAVCFCEGSSMRKIFEAQANLRRKDPTFKSFQWIVSTFFALLIINFETKLLRAAMVGLTGML